MSAREELYAALMFGSTHSPDRSELSSARIDAYRAEVLREAMATILDEENWRECGLSKGTVRLYMAAARTAARMIAPERS